MECLRSSKQGQPGAPLFQGDIQKGARTGPLEWINALLSHRSPVRLHGQSYIAG